MEVSFSTGEIALITLLLGAVTAPLGTIFYMLLKARDKREDDLQALLNYERVERSKDIVQIKEENEKRLEEARATYLTLIQIMRDNTMTTQENTKALQVMVDILGLDTQSQGTTQRTLPKR